jgi:hypothetical protein
MPVTKTAGQAFAVRESLKSMSYVKENFHAKFLGGFEMATSPGYPVCLLKNMVVYE